MARHRDAHDLITAFEHEPAYAFALAADHDRARAAVVDLVVEHVAALIGADDPHALLFQRIDRLSQVRDVGDHQVLARAGAGLRDGRCEPDGAVPWNDDAGHAGALRGAEQRAEGLRVLQRVDHQDERGLGHRIEMKQQLIEIDRCLALNDRHDALMVLDRREPLHLELVDVAHEDSALLRFGEELVHGAGSRAALVRDHESFDDATGAHRLEDGVRSREGFAGVVRWRCRRARARGRATDRLAVLGLTDRAAARTAGATREEVPAAPSATTGAGADTRYPAAVATAPATLRALALSLLAALVIRELASLRVLFVVAWCHGTRWHRTTGREWSRRHRSTLRRAEALSAAAATPSATAATRQLIGTRRSWPGHHRPLVRSGISGTRVGRTSVGRTGVRWTCVGLIAVGRSVVARARFLRALLELFHRHAPLRTRSQRVPSLVSFTRIPYLRSSSARSSSERL